DGTDLDPSKGDTERSLWTGWGNTGNSEDWKRPATFGFLQVVGGPTAVETEAQQPLVFELKNNYPNPFNPVTTINYQVARSTQVRIAVYDLLGKEVATLVDGRMAAGAHVITWNGRNNAGQSVSSGVYFCRMVSPEYTHILKMTLLK
ncbi:MAG TPA: FlgD immunoglobulin-like domain containing protein, partial [bacterium]|nr:FlgD immunoglobulin-like domain containing protein [bacterium]